MGGCRRLLAFFSRIVFSTIVFLTIVGCTILVSTTFFWLILSRTALSAQEVEHFPARGVVIGQADEPSTSRNPARPTFSPSAPPGTPPLPPRRYPVVPANPGLPPDVFQQLVQNAGMIFAGRVTSVGAADLPPGENHPATAVTITFQVEHALRGTLPNESVTIHEWAGLWSRGERYRVGEHVLLFLYGTSKLGLTSPVAGPMGRFALDSQDRIVMSAVHVAAYGGNPILRGRPLVPYVDFAWAVRNAQPRRGIEP
jgi:hypothetical protein